jgi:biopolymer transport protein ExbB/TolQ
LAIEEILFDISDALRVPVLVLALVALAWVIVELGILAFELYWRRGRTLARLEYAVGNAERDISRGFNDDAIAALEGVSFSPAMAETMASIVEARGRYDSEERIPKRLADYEYGNMRRLERSRILVRFGPALGLMGTLIPLSPALAGLAEGNVTELTDNLRVAFSVTVAGLLVGAIAYAISLVRDRIYAQDYSDVEYAAARLIVDPPNPNSRPAKPPARARAGSARS